MTHTFGQRRQRHRILSHISAALMDVREKDPGKDVPSEWTYGRATGHLGSEERTTLFIERCEGYKAMVVRISSEMELPAVISATVRALGLKSIAVPSGLDDAWLGDLRADTGIQVLSDSPQLGKETLDAVDGVLTACAGAIAETGTILLDHSDDQGRRIISLLPESHICVVQAEAIFGGVPEAVSHLKPALAAGRPVTWVSGPSATVDIEFARVEGVHGPHRLFVLVVG